MAMKYHGTLDGLRTLLDQHDVLGSWEHQPNGVFMMRGADGANLHWGSGSKTLWIDGSAAARQRLELDVAGVLHGLVPEMPKPRQVSGL
ncbi:MAG: hypothetical protein ACRYFW_14815 [Janthinobacterium lividum]